MSGLRGGEQLVVNFMRRGLVLLAQRLLSNQKDQVSVDQLAYLCLWMRAAKARPSFQLVVKLVTFTPRYPRGLEFKIVYDILI